MIEDEDLGSEDEDTEDAEGTSIFWASLTTSNLNCIIYCNFAPQ